MNPKVDFFFSKESKWQKEYGKLRTIMLGCGLDEKLKWGCPCYTEQEKNIVLIHGFKEYCAILFFKGALLQDPEGILIQQTKNVQSARQIRFTNAKEIVKLEPVLKAYIYEAIEVEKAGLQIKKKTTADYEIPVEFQNRLNKNRALRTAWDGLTPGRQRGYIFYFSQPKLPATREARVEKNVNRILNGRGLEDE
jgi:uncharacterized protein YdeI (YjbR/CyaY-like superfamily)